jgi:hypothetical protein
MRSSSVILHGSLTLDAFMPGRSDTGVAAQGH